jgi:predicted transcriptional regulator
VDAQGPTSPAGEFVERFAAGMVASGMPRMAARVFALLLSRDDGAATSAELSAALAASPAAISGAVRYLIQVHLITRAHRPSERRDVYRLIGDHWYEIVGDREHDLRQWAQLSREGVAAVDPDTPAGRRLDETARFFEFLIDEMADILQRWRSDVRNR